MEEVSRKSLAVLIREKDYLGIVDHPEASAHEKCVALLELKQYEQALHLAKNNSFAKAYCYYKLGKYGAVLKTAKHKKGECWASIRMQAYYALDRYECAIAEAAELPQSEAVLVNYAAALGLAAAGTGSKWVKEISECSSRAQGLEENMRNEVAYNLCFQNLPYKEKFVRSLKALAPSDPETRVLVDSQVLALNGQHGSIPADGLLRRNREILFYNRDGEEAPTLRREMKTFQRTIYYQNRIKSHFQKSADIPELTEALEDYHAGCADSLIRLVSRMPRANAVHLEALMRLHGIPTNPLARYLKHSQ
ncbi:hypothetical protein NEHOM01_2377 [Nematocida homosporus]|uniref:uncharacterized protein n=1 Tax=Nematocida homosporus TaxID=1912981 RepID=UPI0022207CBF|nr:uncharacterized protein NEHOM01_2377 [Nematocida homosporus]KAI5187800.1 hypothetical protein NEHOM01_2377 [Nematocida homosporus]